MIQASKFWKVKFLINTVALARCEKWIANSEPFQRFLAKAKAVETAEKFSPPLVHRAKATVLMRELKRSLPTPFFSV